MQLEEMRKNEDPRLSFSTPEFKEAQRIFTDNFKVSIKYSSMQQQCYAARTRQTTAYALRSRPKTLDTPFVHCARKTLADRWSGRWSRITPGRHRSSGSWTILCVPPQQTSSAMYHSWPSAKYMCSRAAQVDVDGKPWPLDAAGKPVLKA